jgi:hypothetical protein
MKKEKKKRGGSLGHPHFGKESGLIWGGLATPWLKKNKINNNNNNEFWPFEVAEPSPWPMWMVRPPPKAKTFGGGQGPKPVVFV